MIKLIDILKEGAILLTPDEKDQVEKIIPKIIDIIKGPLISKDKYKEVGWINYQSADKQPGKVFVYVGNDNPTAGGYFQTNDPKNPEDNIILIQQQPFFEYFINNTQFIPVGGIMNAAAKFLTGDENQGIEAVRRVLKHELIHAKDPAINRVKSQWDIEEKDGMWLAVYTSGDGTRKKTFKFKTREEAVAWINQKYLKNYNPSDPKSYYKSWEEFQTMTGQFFESIITGVERIMASRPSNSDIRKIEIALTEILNFFAGKSQGFSQETYDFIQNTKSRNLFQNILKKIQNYIEVNVTRSYIVGNELSTYTAFISQIKKYHPESYNEFLKDLYKVIHQAKDKVNSDLDKERKDFQSKYGDRASQMMNATGMPSNIKLKEMQYINEAKRWQKLAGIIAEAETTQPDPVAEKDAEQGLKQALATLNSGVSTIKPSPKDGELKESLTLGLIAGAPGLISLLGKATNGISSLFQKDKKKGTVVGNALKKWGHQLEENYITVIGTILLKLFPSAYSGQDVHDKSTALYDHAHGVYAAMLAAAAMSSGLGAAQAHSAIAAGLEGGLTAFKASEVVLLAQKIAAV